jgi:hypothetical protein
MTLRRNHRDLAALAALSMLVIAGCGDDGPSRIPYGWGASGTGGMQAAGGGGSAGTAGAGGIGGAGDSGAGGSAGSSGTGGDGSDGAGSGEGASGGAGGSGGASGEGGESGMDSGGSGAIGGMGGMEPDDETTEIGTGDIDDPVDGPAPSRAAEVGGAAFVLVKNWDFGTSGAVRDNAALIAEFQFQDQFGTIASGTSYGAVTVAPTEALAVTANDLGLPDNMQPVDDDPERPFRELTEDSLKTYVRPLSDSLTMVSATAHNTGNGSLVAKWKLPNGGSLLDHDVIWETRIRMPKPTAGYWLGLWASGNEWSSGPELNVAQAFGAAASPANAFRSAAVGGQNEIDYGTWPDTLDLAELPGAESDFTDWHVWTWIYEKDDTFQVYLDGTEVQSGTIRWTLGGAEGAQALEVWFTFILSWGHTQIQAVNLSMPADDFPLEYEIDYSRVYMR